VFQVKKRKKNWMGVWAVFSEPDLENLTGALLGRLSDLNEAPTLDAGSRR